MLEQVELEILNTLNTEAIPMRAGEVSALIDVTYQLVEKEHPNCRIWALLKKSEVRMMVE